MNESDVYWERCWKEEDPTELCKYQDMYYQMKSREIEIFKEHHVINVCDAACGFGAYTLAFASHGFQVHSFDISETAVKITANGLQKYGLSAANVKLANILDTGYADETFDGVIAHAVLDHLLVKDAQKALNELLRITVPGGLIFLSFDNAEEDDFTEKHLTLKDGTMQYTDGARKGMLFHPYDQEQIRNLIKNNHVIHEEYHSPREKKVILKK